MTRYQTWLALGAPGIYCLWVDEMLHAWADESGGREIPDWPALQGVPAEKRTLRDWYRGRLAQADGREAFDTWLADRYRQWTLGLAPDGTPGSEVAEGAD